MLRYRCFVRVHQSRLAFNCTWTDCEGAILSCNSKANADAPVNAPTIQSDASLCESQTVMHLGLGVCSVVVPVHSK